MWSLCCAFSYSTDFVPSLRCLMHQLCRLFHILPHLRQQSTCFQGPVCIDMPTCANNQLASKGQCVSTCPSATFSSAGSCLSCHPDCSSCNGGSFNQCTSCPASRPVLINGRCLPTCSSTQFFDATTGSASHAIQAARAARQRGRQTAFPARARHRSCKPGHASPQIASPPQTSSPGSGHVSRTWSSRPPLRAKHRSRRSPASTRRPWSAAGAGCSGGRSSSWRSAPRSSSSRSSGASAAASRKSDRRSTMRT